MICRQCSSLIGLRSAWHAHAKLSAPGSGGTAGYRTLGHQKLYVCGECRSVLVRGRNTGWAMAVPVAVEAPVSRPATA